MANEIKFNEGQTGIRIILNCRTDMSGIVIKAVYKKPNDRTYQEIAATLYPSDSTKIFFDIFDSGFLDESGVWRVRSFDETNNAFGFPIQKFRVYKATI